MNFTDRPRQTTENEDRKATGAGLAMTTVGLQCFRL